MRRERFRLAMIGCLVGVGVSFLALFGLSAALALFWEQTLRDPWLLSAGLASLVAAGSLLIDMVKRCRLALGAENTGYLIRSLTIGLAGAAGATLVASVTIGPFSRGTQSWSELPVVGLLFGFACFLFVWLLGGKATRHLDSTSVLHPKATQTVNTVSVAEKCAISAIVASFGLVVLWIIKIGAPLGWDESVYALMSRGWLYGTPLTGVHLHRAPALPLSGMIAAAFTESESAFRLVVFGFPLAGILVIWKLGRIVGGPVAGLLAAAAFASGGPTQLESARFLTDVPAAVLLLTATLVLWIELQGSHTPSSRLLAVAPLLAVAHYFRYGSVLPAVLLLVMAGLLWHKTFWRHRRLTGGLIGIGVLFLVPHLIHSVREAGSPWGIVLFTGDIAGRDFPGEGIRYYLSAFPNGLQGWFGGVLAAVGVGAAAGALISGILARSFRPITRFHVFAGGVAVAHTLIIGWFAHGEARFVLYPMWLLMLSGATFIGASIGELGRLSRSAAMVILWGSVTAAFIIATMGSLADRARVAQKFRVVAAAAQAIESDANGACSVLTSLQAQVTWYGHCSTYLLDSNSGREIDGSYDYLLVFGRDERKLGPAISRLIGAVDPDPVSVVEDDYGFFGSAVIYRFRR